MAAGASLAPSSPHARSRASSEHISANRQMSAERWQRLADLSDSALEREPADRASFLASECGDDGPLRREVEALLESHERAGSFGTVPVFRFAAAAATSGWPRAGTSATLSVGECLGRYEILGLLGAGGMGEVY